MDFIERQEEIKKTRKEKYRIARTINNMSLNECIRIRDFSTNKFIIYCYHKIRSNVKSEDT